MHNYNLLYEPWLPVRWCSGAPPSTVGLRETLIRAHEITELATDNPLETIALNRLLAALIASAFPSMATPEGWFAVWDRAQFDPTVLDTYLANYADKFDLLSPTRPFYSDPNTETQALSPMARLQHAATSGNNALLFSHDLDSVPLALPLAEAARALVCTQAAALGGGVAKPFNLCHGPLVGGAFFWLRGLAGGDTSAGDVSLFRALLLNLPPTEAVWGNQQKDRGATWETDKPPVAEKRWVHGIRDLFTFQSRRLHLVLDSEQRAVGVFYNQGSKIDDRQFDDPHLAQVEGKDGFYPLRFRTDRALWQDSTIYLMTKEGTAGKPPATFDWLSRPDNLAELGQGITGQSRFSADVFGMVNDQAKVELWRHERVTVYPDIIQEPGRWDVLNKLIKEADFRADRLREATRAYAMRVRLNKSYGTRLGDVERADRDNLVQMLGTTSRYWVGLGQQFEPFLAQIAQANQEMLGDTLTAWKKAAWRLARKALQDSIESLATDARAFQAVIEAETVLSRGTLSTKTTKPELA
ncbi:type I-E CRISPR-associated protein Cse1/CasA [Fibrella sp. HMF5335]|uniref:Type I-E CRISPR-associated protein Cse1/CasA n=1 Tax=Fibrella rubiginis TaxID=2817060 RepID=A0A939K6C5_9BACT|nr:type I-E CRISPR-associated protein Cse1/CasA [Fibrella rubiginis]MBO0938693.1 type I-E CRISPR-associated protein Cse1/CasA [Fibrella rubiginis]